MNINLYQVSLGLFVLMVAVDHGVCTTPADFARRAGDAMVTNKDNFFSWNYGGALVFDGLQQANQTFGINFSTVVDKYLDMYQTDTHQAGYKILHNITMPFDHAVGDGISLFPIAYLNRAESYSGSRPGYDNTSDVAIVTTVAEKYILGFPYRLPDGTFSRVNGWKGETGKGASFLWGDDQYMGLTLLSRLSIRLNQASYAKFVGQQALNFARYMRDAGDGVYYHGYNHADDRASCCKWGRANGWGMLSHVEVMAALEHFPELRQSPLYTQMRNVLNEHAMAVTKYQSKDGRWRQVVNNSETYLETSSTAMYLSTICRGVMRGWLDHVTFRSVITQGWEGLQKTLNEDGTVSGICIGTGIETSWRDYEARPTLYILSRDGGLGAVLYAAVDMHKYMMWEKKEFDRH